MTGIMQVMLGRSLGFPNGWPVANIGDAYGGGFFAGQLNVSGTKYNLVVAPKTSEAPADKRWGVNGVTTGITSVIDGPANTASLVALGAAYQAAIFCNNLNAGAGLNGYTDWYLPAKNELEVLYYYLKPTTDANDTGSGSNANAVLPEPLNQNYTSGSPAQTTATGVNGFRSGEANAFAANYQYWSSTETDSAFAYWQSFSNGNQTGYSYKNYDSYVRAVRRVPI